MIPQTRKQILKNLNLQYKTTMFKENTSFQEMIKICSQALRKQLKEGQEKDKQIEMEPFQQKEQQQLVWLANLCEKVIYQPIKDTVNILNQYVIQQKHKTLKLTTQYSKIHEKVLYLNLKQALIYSGLSQCKIWFTICKQRKKSGKQFDLDPLIEFFHQIVSRLQLVNPFHMSILPRKHIRHIQKKDNIKKSNNPLFQAVYKSNYDKVIQLIEEGWSVQFPSFLHDRKSIEVRCTHQACLNKDLKMCQLLHRYGADWQAQDTQKMSPLFYAVQAGSLQILRFLIQQVKVNIQKQQVQQRTPFYWACTQGDIEIIDFLYKKGCKINHKSSLGRTALSKSCYLGRVDIVKYLLNCKQIDMYSQDKKGRTALHNAVFGPKGGRQGHKFGTNDKDSPQCAQILLTNGFSVDIVDGQQNTSLHIAMSSQAIDSIRMLLAYDASLTAQNHYKQTPLMTAAKFGHVQAVRIVYEEYKASIQILDKYNKNVLLLTAKFKQNGQEGINPVFSLLVQDFVRLKKQKEEVNELDRTFKQLLMTESYKQLSIYLLTLTKHKIQFPKLCSEQIDKVLKMSISEQGRGLQKQIGKSLGQVMLQGQLINEQESKNILMRLIRNSELKILQYIHEKKILNIHHIILECKQLFQCIQENILKQKVITFSLLCLNFNWLYYRMNNQSNILHLLVRKQRSGAIIQVVKSLNGKIPQHILTNKFVKVGLNYIKQLFEGVDGSGLTPYELSLILKNRSLSKILEQKLKESQLSQNIHGLDIKEYHPIIQNNQEQINIFVKGHEREKELCEFEGYIQNCNIEQLQQKYITKYKHNHNISTIWKESDNRVLEYVECQQKLLLIQELNKQQIIGIDVQYFTHQSVTIMSTLQLSSFKQDYIIDCLLIPLSKIKKYIQTIFQSPNILKIIHGADNDLILIKSHFNISLINFIDTSRVDIELRTQNKNQLRGLSTLCKQYLSINMSKEYQVSQWRIRPIPKVMLQYARKDSFILLWLLPIMLNQFQKPQNLREIILSGCKQVRRNKKQSQPLLQAIKQV